MTPSTAARLHGIPRSGIREIMELAAEQADAIHLEVGEPDFETPPHVIEAAAAAARAGFTRYTASRGIMDLRQAIADKLKRVNDVVAEPETDIVVTAGAANALLITLAAVVDPSDVVLLPDPGWPNYASVATMLGLRVVRYPLRRRDQFQPDVDEIARLARRTRARAILVNSPHNPTGTIVSRDRLAAIVELADGLGATLISDECYDQIVLAEGQQAASSAALHPHAPVISVFSFSKTYAMTGWRIGYAAGPAGSLSDMARIQEAWLSCCSAPVQKAAEAALLGNQSIVERMVGTYRARRDRAVQAADAHGLSAYPPSGAFYMMVDIGAAEPDGQSFARRLLTQRAVAVAPGETFGAESSGMVRISLAAHEEDIATGLRRLSELLPSG